MSEANYSPQDDDNLDWDDNAAEKPVYPRLPRGQYGTAGEATLKELTFESKEVDGRDGLQTQRWARLVVEVIHPEKGKVTIFGGGMFGKFNTNLASKTGSKWPAFAQALGISKGMSKADAKAAVEGKKVVVDTDIRQFKNRDGEQQTENELQNISLF